MTESIYLPELALYIENLRGHLRLSADLRDDVTMEVTSDLEERVHDMVEQGVSKREATRRATEDFGDPKDFAAHLYSAYKRGSWVDACLAALPHLILGLLFAYHLWLDPRYVIPVLALGFAVSVAGWMKGRPLWVYSWMGYALLPFLLMALVAIAALGQRLFIFATFNSNSANFVAWAVLTLYLLVIVGAASVVLMRVSRDDWVYASLMILPLPVLVISLLLLQRWPLHQFVSADETSALMFSFLALATGAFTKLGTRILKIGILIFITPVVFLLAGGAMEGTERPLSLVLVALIPLLLLLSPAILAWNPLAQLLAQSQDTRWGRKTGELWATWDIDRIA